MPSGFERTDITDAEVWRVYNETPDRTLAETGALFDMTPEWAGLRVRRYRKANDLPQKPFSTARRVAAASAGGSHKGEWDALDQDGPRCRCGLRLPCESCIPTAVELATSRRAPVIDTLPSDEERSGPIRHPRAA